LDYSTLALGWPF